MIRWLIFISWILSFHKAWADVEEPTFVIESDHFSVGQAHDYRIGNFERELSETEMLEILNSRRYEKTHQVEVKNKHYLYFAYVVDNRSGRTQTVYVRFPLWFSKSAIWLQKDGRLIALKRYPRWGDTFFIDLPPGVHHMIGTRLSAASQQGQAIGVRILDFQSLENEWRSVEFMISTVFGAVGIMIFYNIGMYILYRRIFFVFYIIYSGVSLYVLAMMNGYLPYHIPHMSLAGLIGSLSLLQFCNTSLNIRQKFPRVYRSSLIFALLCFLLSAHAIVTGHWIGFALCMPLVMAFCCLASIVSLRGGYRPALYFVIGWGVFLICCSAVVINLLFWGIPVLGYLVIIGFAAEVSLFSFAIGQKVRLAEQEALRGNQHAFNQLKKVFYPHQIDKIKEGRALEETMPTSERDACALCFDIVGSSRIESSHGRIFIEDSLKACESALTEHYDGVSMVATGYRVKEMGDGFLCTVGYPFRTVMGQNPVIGAMELALNFVKIFQKRVDDLASGQLIFCSVGIAFGNIQGHFPKVGVVEYEVDGRAVDLAQRYEAFRKIYFPEGPAGHVITVHSTVFHQLPAHLQKNFISVDLREAKIILRDDPDASHVHYCLLKPDAVREPLQVSA